MINKDNDILIKKIEMKIYELKIELKKLKKLKKNNIVNKLGGYNEVQNILNLGNTTVFKWCQKGYVPLKYWDQLKKIADEKNISYKVDDFMNL